jgi:Uma2 family endonuclease
MERFTYDDWLTTPEDRFRREILDGQLVVTPSPPRVHARALGRLTVTLAEAAPSHLEVLSGLGWRAGDHDVVVPDLVVIDAGLTDDYLTRTLHLVVEVLARSTRTTDLHNKKALYERQGVPCYWVVDPKGDGESPVITVFELVEGVFTVRGHHEGDVPWIAERPFPVEIIPARLTGPRG